jgi:RNA polymerase sigma-70 factor (ECF subfamily)
VAWDGIARKRAIRHNSTEVFVASISSAAFEALYDRHNREVWAVAYARRLDADAALDVMQEVFLRFWKQGQSREPVLNPRAWLLRVARNVAEDQAKSAFHRNGTQPPQALNGLRSHVPGPLESLLREEQFAQVRAFLQELPAADREILTLRYALEYETDKIADLLEINAAAVHMRLSRARQRLAELLSLQGANVP